MKERPLFTAALVFSSRSLVPSLAAFTSFCICGTWGREPWGSLAHPRVRPVTDCNAAQYPASEARAGQAARQSRALRGGALAPGLC